MKHVYHLRYTIKILLILFILTCQISCVSKKVYQVAINKSDSICKLYNAEVKTNYSLSLDYLKLQRQYSEHLRNDSIITNNSSNVIELDHNILSFPNPPPQPTCRFTFNSKLFNKCKTYQDVNEVLINMLNKAGYDNKTTYFLFDNGFVITTDVEQINNDATPKSINQRWLSTPSKMTGNNFSLKEYFRVLFSAQPGYYRSFAFIVSPSIYSFSANDYTKELFSKYLSQGSIGLPIRIGLTKLPEGLRVSVLIYEFKKPENSDNANLIIGGLNGYEHLKRSFIINSTAHGN